MNIDACLYNKNNNKIYIYEYYTRTILLIDIYTHNYTLHYYK